MDDMYKRLFALTGELLCTANADGYFVELSPRWEEVLGWSLEELRSQPFLSFVHDDDRDATLAAAARLSGGTDLVHFENRYACKDGSYRRLQWAAAAPRRVGDLLCALARDISGRAELPDLSDDLEILDARTEALRASMVTPIIQIWQDVVTMPVVGLVDSMRAADMKRALLDAVSRTGAKFAIVDLTGVEVVDTATADHLLRVMKAVQLLGARCVITGIQPSVAQIIVSLGLGLPGIVTLRSLREGLQYCLKSLGYRVHRNEDVPAPTLAKLHG